MFRASLCTLSSSLFRRSSATKIYIYISLLRLRAFCFRFPPPSPPHCSRFLSRILPRADRYKLQNAVGHCSTHHDLSVGNDRRDGGGFSSPPLSSSSFLLVHSWKLGTFVAPLPRNVCLFVRSFPFQPDRRVDFAEIFSTDI